MSVGKWGKVIVNANQRVQRVVLIAVITGCVSVGILSGQQLEFPDWGLSFDDVHAWEGQHDSTLAYIENLPKDVTMIVYEDVSLWELTWSRAHIIGPELGLMVVKFRPTGPVRSGDWVLDTGPHIRGYRKFLDYLVGTRGRPDSISEHDDGWTETIWLPSSVYESKAIVSINEAEREAMIFFAWEEAIED